MMTPFGPQMEQPQFPQFLPFPMPQTPFPMGFGQAMTAMPQQPFMPFGPQTDDGWPAMPQLPFMPFGPQDDDEQPAMLNIPFPMPFSMEELPEIQTPFGTLPQPYELYEGALRDVIGFLNSLLAQSEKAHEDEDEDEGSEGDASSDEAEAETAGNAAFSFLPGPGAPQPPEGGLLTTNSPLGGLLGKLFDASDTDYFYED